MTCFLSTGLKLTCLNFQWYHELTSLCLNWRPSRQRTLPNNRTVPKTWGSDNDPLTEFFNGNCSFRYKIVTKRQKREIKLYHRTFLVFFIVLHHFSGLKSLRIASRTPSPFACGTRVTSRDSPKWRAFLQAKEYLERFHISDKSVELYISAWITQSQGHWGAHAHLRCLGYNKWNAKASANSRDQGHPSRI